VSILIAGQLLGAAKSEDSESAFLEFQLECQKKLALSKLEDSDDAFLEFQSECKKKQEEFSKFKEKFVFRQEKSSIPKRATRKDISDYHQRWLKYKDDNKSIHFITKTVSSPESSPEVIVVTLFDVNATRFFYNFEITKILDNVVYFKLNNEYYIGT
jgi:hypothetical protein